MPSIAIDRRFRGPPTSANGGYVCGLVAKAMGGSGEVTLRAPPPLDQPLEIVQGADGSVQLRNAQTLLATGRTARLAGAEIPAASFAEAEDAASRSLYSDERTHQLPGCFVCGPGRAPEDGLRIFVGPLAASPSRRIEALAAAWVPSADLAGSDGRVRGEFVWSVLDCPSGQAAMSARHLGLNGNEPVLLLLLLRIVGSDGGDEATLEIQVFSQNGRLRRRATDANVHLSDRRANAGGGRNGAV